MADLMPVIFFGHGNPMNALSRNSYTESWAAVGKSVPHPKTVLAISAHWYISGCAVTVNPAPRTIHDFGGFPEKLYQMKYPAPGNLELTRRVKELLSPLSISIDGSWGLDHGTWAVLCQGKNGVESLLLTFEAQYQPIQTSSQMFDSEKQLKN
jgi:4,5-DOPA dioxygenase extradiol